MLSSIVWALVMFGYAFPVAVALVAGLCFLDVQLGVQPKAAGQACVDGSFLSGSLSGGQRLLSPP